MQKENISVGESANLSAIELACRVEKAGFTSDVLKNNISSNNDLLRIVKSCIEIKLTGEYYPRNFLKNYKKVGEVVSCPDFEKIVKSVKKISHQWKSLFLTSQDLKKDAIDSEIIPNIQLFEFPDFLWVIDEIISNHSEELIINSKLLNLFYVKKDSLIFIILICFRAGELCIGKYLPNEHKKYKKNSRIFSPNYNVN